MGDANCISIPRITHTRMYVDTHMQSGTFLCSAGKKLSDNLQKNVLTQITKMTVIHSLAHTALGRFIDS